jgi:hypothetical protein
MPLILAIEPDRRQANQLTTMVRGRLRAELVLADSAERALAALGDRIPDLILTTALLSPKDETALAERLRRLDGTAAHVQTLTIPVLASPAARAASTGRGMLAALRRDRGHDASLEGCDPAVFAEQCKEYLERAHEDRSAARETGAIEPPQPIAEPPAEIAQEFAVGHGEPAGRVMPEASSEPLEQEFLADADTPATEPVRMIAPAVVASARKETAPIVVPVAAAAEKPTRAPRVVAEEPPSSLIAALEEFESEFAVEQPAAVEPSIEAGLPVSLPIADAPAAAAKAADPQRSFQALIDLDLSALLDDPVFRTNDVGAGPADEPAIYDLDETALDLAAVAFTADSAPANAEQAAAIETKTADEALADITAYSETELYSALPRLSVWPILDAPLAQLNAARPARPSGGSGKPSDEQSDWLDIIEAIRRDAEQAKLTRTADADPAPRAEQAPKRKRRRRNLPAQDEWGLFDPTQCGFAALIQKLEEITDNEDGPAPRRA